MKFRPVPKGMKEQIDDQMVNIAKRKCLKCGKKFNDCTCLYPNLMPVDINARSIAMQRTASSIHADPSPKRFSAYYCDICGKTFGTIKHCRSHVASDHSEKDGVMKWWAARKSPKFMWG